MTPVPCLYRVTIGHYRPDFHAWLTGRRRRSVVWALLRNSARYPLPPRRVRGLIQWQGMRLWSRGLEPR